MEETLVANGQTDPEAFGRLYDTYYQPVFGFMYNRTGNAEVAKDLVSETFFQALKNLHRYKPRQGASFKSWLFAIAVAQVGNYYRSRSKFLEVTTEEAPELIGREDFRPDIAYRMGEDATELEGQINLLREMIGKLNHRQQTILTLRYFSHMTVPEIATTIGMKEGTIKSHIHRALKKLQALMVGNELCPASNSTSKNSSKSWAPKSTLAT
ncbi:MAG TPA: sigma-70 family RNA polymerase sigma factor [Patescibacteria group bacterium]|nr:sigma-70 family RNA polymerase sigma factor [Patescibacteria group bacterium]